MIAPPKHSPTQLPKQPRSVYASKLSEFRDIAFAGDEALARRGCWRSLFGDRIGSSFDGRIIFEIGCADGDFLARIAAKFPQTAFIGLDWKCKAIYDAAVRVMASGLSNVAFIRGRAQDLLGYFAPREVDEIWIFHPEPCDRDVEIKNRLISARFFADAHVALRDGGSICMKTDHPDYYGHSLRVDTDCDIVANVADFWRDQVAQTHVAGRCFAGEMTGYEARFARKRKPIRYIEWTKR